MWKTGPEESATQESSPVRQDDTSPSTQRVASLGPSLVIRGTLSGQEDLLIEGQVEGEISLRKHSVTVGPKGRVKADIFSKSISIEGEVEGNLFGEDQVTIRRSGKVRGNVTSPRVGLEDGSKFKGAIDMKPPPQASEQEKTEGQRSKTTTRRRPREGGAPPVSRGEPARVASNKEAES